MKKRKHEDEIIKLHECTYHSYRKIAEIVGCSVGHVNNVINKLPLKERKPIQKKKYDYVPRDQMSPNRILSQKIGGFKGRTQHNSKVGKKTHSFTIQDVYDKFSSNPICYLTGKRIDLTNSKDYTLDHIIPKACGGDNSLNNLGFLKADVNYAKNSMTIEDFIQLCIDVLKHNGYSIEKL
jgi:5-methylcytosine-specific restriction endonuclease McrA